MVRIAVRTNTEAWEQEDRLRALCGVNDAGDSRWSLPRTRYGAGMTKKPTTTSNFSLHLCAFTGILLLVSKKIRAVQIAQHLGISSQELRKFIAEVNFGVKPADREFPESIASGIVRFISRKLGKKVPPLIVFADVDDEDELTEEATEGESTPKEESALEKLSKIAVQSREDMKEKAKREEEAKKAPASQAIFRKIEISPEESAKAKKTMEKKREERKTKEEKEKERLEQKVFVAAKRQEMTYKKKEGVVELPGTITVKEFAEKVGVKVSEVVAALMKNGVFATINNVIDFDTCSIIAEELAVQVKKSEMSAKTEDLFAKDLEKLLADEKENLLPRPPVVAVMGHVDHGKTKILDTIRKTKVVESEAGGITQRIGAHQIVKNGKRITFLDTPGHEAFTAMRARGAKTADIAILVVAADEGVKPQTIEAINHAKEAGVAIIVAINKIDRPTANIEKVKGELAAHDLAPEDWGGKTVCVPVSALEGRGIDDLLEMVLLTADMLELKANPKRSAVGTVVESHLDEALGSVATILVNTGTLKVGDNFIVGHIGGKVKSMLTDDGKHVKEAGPSDAVQIAGLDGSVAAGEILQVFDSPKIVRKKLEELTSLSGHKEGTGLGVGEIMDLLKQGKMKFLKVVLKADTDGSLEAVKQELEKIKHEEVGIKVIHSGVGSVTESDVLMAAASQGIVAGFNIRVSPRVRRIAEQEKVEIQSFEIIFELTDMLKKILEGLLEPEFTEIISGEAVAKKIFWTKGKTMIVGCRVEKGFLEKGQKVRVLRNGELAGEGVIAMLQHFENKVNRIEENQECGIQFEGNVKVEEGDTIEGLKTEKKIKTL